MEQSRFCKDCGEELHGRIDKKFCDDQCRSNYNNRLYSKSNSLIKQINSILKRNRKILEELNPSGKAKVPRKRMISRGFDFMHVTSYYQTQSGKTYFFCYEQGYLSLDNDEVLLVKRDDNIL